MNNTKDLITDRAIDLVWGNANFGPNTNKRELIADALQKVSDGYANGYTIQCILIELGLITKIGKGYNVKHTLTLLGEEYLTLSKG